MSGRKRKASDDDVIDRMSTSPTASPQPAPRYLPNGTSLMCSPSSSARSNKRTRVSTNNGRCLDLPRLLETLDPNEMRSLLQTICDQNPAIAHEVTARAPRPSIDSTLAVLDRYESAFKASFPFGNRASSDYTYHRVRHSMYNLIDALRDFTPHFLPPNESQPSTSLIYLDAVTSIVHRIPEWETFTYNAARHDAYDELASAWVLAIREASKRAGGFALQHQGWDQKIIKHNELCGGRLQSAVDEARSSAGRWINETTQGSTSGLGLSSDRSAVRQQLMSGTYGSDIPVGPGRRW